VVEEETTSLCRFEQSPEKERIDMAINKELMRTYASAKNLGRLRRLLLQLSGA
jgi:hypothetical protein